MKTFKNFGKKSKSRRGESLAELLIAVIIVALGCLLIATMYAASMSINIEAKKSDDGFYDALTEMEFSGGDGVNASVRLTDGEGDNIEIPVKQYGNDGFSSYRK